MERDPAAAARQGGDPSALFDFWLNTCCPQGSRTIRTEEAILISLAFLQPAIARAHAAGA